MPSQSDSIQLLRERGYVLVPRAGARVLVDFLEAIGRVLHVEEVVVDGSSSSLLKSSAGLSLHTDHHRADVILWYCIASSDRGGTTLLVDGLEVYQELAEAHQAALQNTWLQEHSVFSGDRERHPIVSMRAAMPRLYYSYWLADEQLTVDQRTALDAFEESVRRAPRVEVKLEPGDLLAIDNGRMLHGRTAIEGSQARHLRRYWIASP